MKKAVGLLAAVLMCAFAQAAYAGTLAVSGPASWYNFHLDGAWQASSPPYSWTFGSLSGAHTVEVVGGDDAQDDAYVANFNGSSVSGTITAKLTPAPGSTSTTYSIDGSRVGSSSGTATFAFNTTTLANGTHNFSTTDLNSTGTVATSTLTMAVQNSGATPTPTPTATPTGTPEPDLIVTAISWAPASPITGNHVVFSSVVKNQGNAATPAGVVIGESFWIDGTQVSWSDTDSTSLAPGASVTLTANSGPNGVNYWVATTGSHTVQGWVNDINRFTESNTANNKLNVPITVSTTASPTPTASPTASPAPTGTPKPTATPTSTPSATPSATPTPVAGREVFTHYMLAFSPHGVSQAGYEQDIADAQSVGVDGFVLNFGSWSQENGRYKTPMQEMYAAADAYNSAHGTHFVLMQSPDCSQDSASSPSSDLLPAADVVNAAQTYCSDAAQFTYNGKCVLSGWQIENLGNASYWQTNVLTPLSNAGHPVSFVPQSFLNLGETPTSVSTIQSAESSWKGVATGFNYWGLAGVPTYTDSPSSLTAGEAFATATHNNGMLFMAGPAPQYWGALQSNGRRYFEYSGGQGIANEWASIINNQKPEWIELVTWDDFGESWLTPSTSGAPYQWDDVSHAGAADLMAYYIKWYKTGTQPAITKDQLFYFFRTHPKAATASNDSFGPVTQFHGNVLDDVYVTTLLTAPATLSVDSGGHTTNFSLSAGITHTPVPFSVGTQSFTITRNGTTVISQTDPVNIISNPTFYNFMYETGDASGS